MRICHTNNDNKNKGGAYIITHRLEREMRKYGYLFDYLTMDEFIDTDNEDVALLPDSKAFSARLRGNRWTGHIKLPFYSYSVFRREKYPIVSIDVDLAWKALLYAVPAKLAGSKVIVHSHSTGVDGDHKRLKRIAHAVGRQILPWFTDKYVACAASAGKWMFPRRKQDQVEVVLNGTDLSVFCYDEEIRNTWRKSLGVGGQLVIGNIGIVSSNKNQEFLVRMLGRMKARGISAVLLLVGPYTDNWEKRIKDLAGVNGVADQVILYGFSKDTAQLLNAMDVYVCSSFVEGAPLTLYEAQATGLPCVMTDSISDASVISPWVVKQNLNSGADIWCDSVIELHEKYVGDRALRKVEREYGMEYMGERMRDIYDGMVKK